MKKYTNNTLLLIVVSLIIAAVLNFLLGAIPGLSSDKTIAQANSSSVQEITPASKAATFTVQEPATVSSLQSTEKLQPTPTPAPTSEPIQTSIPKAVPSEDYQDVQWIANVQKHSALLSKDIEEVGNTTSNLDSDELATYGQYIIDDTQTATEENKQYVVSPKCQDAKNEWDLALRDYSSAGEFMIKASEEANSNDINGDDVEEALSLIDSGSGHLNSAKEFLNTSA